MNILQTLHPPGKDYGLMKIEEPKTPYSHYKDTVDGEPISDEEEAASSSTNLNLQMVSEKIKLGRTRMSSQDSKDEDDSKECDDDDQSDLEELTEEEKKKRKEFEMKRKMHYNEFQAVKLARKLLEEEDDDDEDDDDNSKHKSISKDNEDEEGMASDREIEQDYAYSAKFSKNN